MCNTIDTEVINRLRRGSEEAFEMVYSAYYNHIFFIALKFFNNNTSLAEDVVQDTFIAVYENASTLKAPEAFYSWMKKITYFQCIKLLKKEKKIGSGYTDVKSLEYLENVAVDRLIVEDIYERETISIIISEINKFKCAQKQVAYLRFFEGMTTKEIAETLHVPEGTVKSRLNNIKKNLQDVLTAQGIATSGNI